jgi:protein-disulfide isomerase
MMRFAATGLAGLLAGLLGCASNQGLEKKVTALSVELADTRKELAQRLDDLALQMTTSHNLERKLDQLAARQEAIAELMKRPAPAPAARPPRPEPDRSLVYAAPIAGAASIGPADAKVTMVVAFDYACPYCERAQQTLVDLRQRYGANLRMVFQHLVVHPRTAMAPALAACAADKQGKFTAMDAKLWDAFRARTFDPDRCWEDQNGCPLLEGFASAINLDPRRFKADLKTCAPEIATHMRELQQLAVAATPSFFINGRFMSGAQPIESFASLIDEELAKADGRIRAGTPKRAYYQKWVLDAGLKQVAPPQMAAPSSTPTP